MQFATDKRSILPVGDISDVIADEDVDIAVLEEPEHLTWFHHGKSWKARFNYVIGIIHTNYLEYVRREKNGRLKAFLLKYMNSWVVGIYCHKVIRLSAATQEYPRSMVCNVHGVNPKFLEIGLRKLERQKLQEQPFTKGAYYIGKMVWSKGYKDLLKLLRNHQKELAGLEVDLYGHGEDSDQITEAARKLDLTIRVHPGRDHADPIFHDYKVFLNPSTTDVVCTTTAEALAMGKIVVCADHPSNEFFKQFPNCRVYVDGKGFVRETLKALGEQPSQLTDQQRHQLSWEAATERFVKAAELEEAGPGMDMGSSKGSSESWALSKKMEFASTSMNNVGRRLEEMSAYLHKLASGNEASRRAFGAIPGSLEPDEELCRDLGLTLKPKPKPPSRKRSKLD
ncbi:PREDICTED: digalactosyldiacylglycerol synthase 2, chloroplastic isoform X2 [Tarenaya hassleriana]|uniref:digalactosyldiacylglycerol synthase 2, chloroplastic isoform X2 n=1 Tax=Tarenaya hassleriana TaxID=28532 RepID=UPI00053C1DD5|nr:PREDICTED: digalactosyldiacylglycerol synthase 2, chloroplastic isoform X2 [Tarenaya hassleriana]